MYFFHNFFQSLSSVTYSEQHYDVSHKLVSFKFAPRSHAPPAVFFARFILSSAFPNEVIRNYSLFKFHSVHLKLVSPQETPLEIFFLFTSLIAEMHLPWGTWFISNVFWGMKGKMKEKNAQHQAGFEPTTARMFTPKACALPLCCNRCPQSGMTLKIQLLGTCKTEIRNCQENSLGIWSQ